MAGAGIGAAEKNCGGGAYGLGAAANCGGSDCSCICGAAI
jgi:hypothetical protein